MAIYKNKASQKLLVYATDLAGDPVTGKATNITAYLSKDGGAASATNDTNPTEVDATNLKGFYAFDTTQAETNADVLVLTASCSTANVFLEPVVVYTEPEIRDADVREWVGYTQTGAFDFNSVQSNVASTISAINNGVYGLAALEDILTHSTYGLSALQVLSAAIKAVTDKVDTALVVDGVVYQFTANALELAPGTSGDVTLAASQPNYAPAKAGDAMTLTAGERTSIGTAVWASATRTLTSFGSLVADIWHHLLTGITTAGSIGKLIKDYLDAAISSRSTYAGADTPGTTTLLGRIIGTLLAGNHTAQTGDSYGRIGAAGAGLTALAKPGDQMNIVENGITATQIGAGAIQADAFENDAISAAAISAAAVTKVQNGLALTTHVQEVENKIDAVDVTTTADAANTLLVKAVTDKVDTGLVADGAVYKFTANALEEAPGASFSVQDIVDGVLDEPSADHLDAGSIGEKISTGGSGGIPPATQTQIDTIEAGVASMQGGMVTYTSPVVIGTSISIARGYDYLATDSRQIALSSTDWPVLTGATVALVERDAARTSVQAMSLVLTGAGTQTVQLEFTDVETTAMTAGVYNYRVSATLAGGSVVDLCEVRMTVR